MGALAEIVLLDLPCKSCFDMRGKKENRTMIETGVGINELEELARFCCGGGV